jgi:hypothetical protein
MINIYIFFFKVCTYKKKKKLSKLLIEILLFTFSQIQLINEKNGKMILFMNSIQ